MTSSIPTDQMHPEHRILRRPDVEKKVGFKRSQIYKLMKHGLFPQRVSIGKRAVGWDSIEVDQWIADRRNERL